MITNRQFIPFQVSFFTDQLAVTLLLMISGLQFAQPQSNGLSGLETVLEFYYKLQLKPKAVPEFKDAL